jgi:hypothetical protein
MTKGAAYRPPFQINTVTSRNGKEGRQRLTGNGRDHGGVFPGYPEGRRAGGHRVAQLRAMRFFSLWRHRNHKLRDELNL